MSELSAQRSRIDKIKIAAQFFQDSINCGICLEIFKEPVTIRCGHRFCKICILRVTNNENSACPFCNSKIRKRSIPTEGNKTIKLLIKRFHTLIQAIKEDSGIDVLVPINKVRSTKESVSLNDKPSASKFEQTSSTSKGSSFQANHNIKNTKGSVPLYDKPSTSKFEQTSNISKESSNQTNRKSSNSKIKSHTSSRRNSLSKKSANKNSNNPTNTLHKYLSTNSDNVPDEELHTTEKVKSWLSNITPHIDDVGTSDSNNEDNSPFLKKGNQEFKVPEVLEATKVIEEPEILEATKVIEEPEILEATKVIEEPEILEATKVIEEPEILEVTKIIEDFQSPESNNQSKVIDKDSEDSSSGKEEQVKYKETQSRIQELEMIARRKKSNSNLLDKNILKTPNSVPAATHSDAYDWRRVKKIGKEMQANTFKSLNVSVEKNLSTATVDDIVPSTSSVVNDNKSKKKLSLHENANQKETSKTITNTTTIKTINSSMDTSDSHKGENISLSCMGEEQLNDIIGIVPSEVEVCAPERSRRTPTILNKEYASKLEQSTPLKRLSIKNSGNDNENSPQNSQSVHKLPLKKNSINSENSKLISPQPVAPDRQTNQSENNSPRKISPERPKSRLSLRLHPTKTSEQYVRPSITPASHHSDVQNSTTRNFHKKNSDSNINSTTSRLSRISFKKLGKICKKRKNVPFLQLGKIRPKIITKRDNQEMSNVLVKSNVLVNFDIMSLVVNNQSNKENSVKSDNKELKILSPEEDSQLQYLVIESPHRQRNVRKRIDTTECENRSTIETTCHDIGDVLMEKAPICLNNPESDNLMEVDQAYSVYHLGRKIDLKENYSAINEEVHVKIENSNNCEEISEHSKENVKDNSQRNLLKVRTSKNCSPPVAVAIPVTTSVSKSSLSSDSESEDDQESVYSESNKNASLLKEKVKEDEDEEQDIISISLKESDKLTMNPSAQKIVKTDKTYLSEDEKNTNSEAESSVSSKSQQKSIKKSAFTSSNLSSIKEDNKGSEIESSVVSDASDVETRSKSRKSCNSARTLNSSRDRSKVSEAETNADSNGSKFQGRSRKTSSSSSSTLSSVKERNKITKAKSNASNLYISKVRADSKKATSSTASTLSSIKRTSKKKRTHSDSSSDDEDVTSIIGKWCGNTDIPVTKKAKIVTGTNDSIVANKSKTKFIPSEDDIDDDMMDVTLVPEENQIKTKMLQRDPPIDDIISKVKSFKEAEPSTSKLVTIPSSLMSADLFESNEPCIHPSNHINSKQANSEEIDKSQDEIDTTLVNIMQTSRKKSNTSESSDGSNKENNKANKINPSSVNVGEVSAVQINEIENCERYKVINNSNVTETNAYHISESLLNITQEQLVFKQIEKDLIGIDFSALHNNKNNVVVEEIDKHSTPQVKKKQSQTNEGVKEEEEYDSENILATPCAKKGKRSIKEALPNQLLSKFNAGSQINSSEIFSPGNDKIDLIPAITPMKNRTSYPLCHSTPVISTSNSESQLVQPKIILVCSGLLAEQVQKVQLFAKHFRAKYQAAFSMDVTHVITSTEDDTKVGQRTFKYIQGIAYQKHVLNYQWILDCLDKNTIVDEEDEKYEVLDGDVFESGAKKSRRREKGLFENFAFLCLEPLNSISLTEFKHILKYNDAVVVDTVPQLAAETNKYRVIIVSDNCDLNEKKLQALKLARCAIITFDWIVDSISQYHAISFAPYLQETDPQELLAFGFPPEYLIEEEYAENDEEDDLE